MLAVRAFSSCGEQELFFLEVHRLLTAVTSLVVEHGLWGVWASVVVTHGLNCFFTCGIFPDQGSRLCLLHWQAESFFFFLIMYFAASGLICYTWDLRWGAWAQ